ncbi:MAG: hypothetical protein WCT08_03575 [Patescibacteria group bacterium]|jgi:hypothetical protein
MADKQKGCHSTSDELNPFKGGLSEKLIFLCDKKEGMNKKRFQGSVRHDPFLKFKKPAPFLKSVL